MKSPVMGFRVGGMLRKVPSEDNFRRCSTTSRKHQPRILQLHPSTAIFRCVQPLCPTVDVSCREFLGLLRRWIRATRMRTPGEFQDMFRYRNLRISNIIINQAKRYLFHFTTVTPVVLSKAVISAPNKETSDSKLNCELTSCNKTLAHHKLNETKLFSENTTHLENTHPDCRTYPEGSSTQPRIT